MEHITKVFFNPLATTKAQIRTILEDLPAGSAHPFSPDHLLLCRTATGIDEIDISSYSEEFFFNAVDLGDLGETIQKRMANFQSQLELFNNEYIIQQAPAATFKVPILSDQIAIFAVSERYPTYYDLCMADAQCNTSCYSATGTFAGVTHSGDINQGSDLLHTIQINERLMPRDKYAIFVSGYTCTKLTKFKERNPVVLIANHAEKLLYIVPVPLDAASIGDATLCTPVVIKRDGGSLICSILPKPTTDTDKMCSDSRLQSASFNEAIRRANFTISSLAIAQESRDTTLDIETITENLTSASEDISNISMKRDVVFATQQITLPSIVQPDVAQVIRFGTGLNFMSQGENQTPETSQSSVVLPCIFGSRLEGPMLLATGKVPSNIPFPDEDLLRTYYEQLKSVVVFVDEKMTDSARNIATPWRINALFVLQVIPETPPKDADLVALLDSVNINAVTALAGPQSLVLVQLSGKYYFYRGIANRTHLDTSNLAFGSDITEIIKSIGVESILEPRAKRLIRLDEANTIILPDLGQKAQPQDLKNLFEKLSLDQMETLKNDISAIVPQLQVLLNQKDLKELSAALISILSVKVSNETAPLRTAYIKYLTQEYKSDDPDSVRQKGLMLGNLRKRTKYLQTCLESTISHLSNMMSSQTTSRRTHDLKRLLRQVAIQGNVEAAQTMTFDTLAGFLETYAGDMGVLLLNIETTPYSQLLGNLNKTVLDASPCCDLDSRVLFLEGFDAGIIIEQSQANHHGPLKHQLGPSRPTLALPYLSQERGIGSMLAWVCWDEFVNLEEPFSVRWMEKCNESHIAALRIIMRETLSKAIASREYDLQPGSFEIGQLMSALLMAAMSKLAAMRTTVPTVTIKAEDTVTKLIRGLFGNLLTTAGSGVRPMSMVWQLFSTNAQFDVPSTEAAWSWYETVVGLYPFSSWHRDIFYLNLEKLLDKTIIRVITKNEKKDELKANRAEEMIRFCKLRNIQLEHSRTIITILMRMLTEDVDYKAIAERLKNALPDKLERESQSYARMITYLKKLAKGGKRRAQDDLIAASVYTKRSAAFSELKYKVATACEANDKDKIIAFCQEIVSKHAEIAMLWNLKPQSFHVQNMSAYKGLLEATLEGDIDDSMKAKNKRLYQQAISDAERKRIPWQVGKEGQFGDGIEPLDEDFIHEIMTGEKLKTTFHPMEMAALTIAKTEPEGIAQFSSVVKAGFITQMEKTLSPEDVCNIMGVPESTMRVFVKALNPVFTWDDLGKNFKSVMVALLQDRKDRERSHPTKTLFGMDNRVSKIN